MVDKKGKSKKSPYQKMRIYFKKKSLLKTDVTVEAKPWKKEEEEL